MLKSLLISSLLITGINVNYLSLEKATAQNPPAETYQPGFWQPVARVDLNRPINIKIINKAGILIDYAVTDVRMAPISVDVDKTVLIENIEPSIYIVIYPDTKDPNSSRIYLYYEINVTEDNIVEITVKQTEDGTKSHRTFNLQTTGAIFLY